MSPFRSVVVEAVRSGCRAIGVVSVLSTLGGAWACSSDETGTDMSRRNKDSNNSRETDEGTKTDADEDTTDEDTSEPSSGTGSNAEGAYGVNTVGECRFVAGQIEEGLQGDCGQRCSEATLMALEMCMAEQVDCEANAYLQDDTPPVPIEWTVLIEIQADELNCDVCTLAQNISCQYTLCAPQAQALDDCIIIALTDEELNACDTLEGPLDDCLRDNQVEFDKCKDNREAACFAPPM